MVFSTSFALVALLFTVQSQAAFDCVITVPPNPLTAQGLATPYKVTGCDQTQFADQGSFVEAAIIDTATGAVQIYHPLVINQNMVQADFIAPVLPTLPANSVVGLWFGSNAATVTLKGTIQTCVNGDGKSIFGQFAYCNAPAFFTAAQTAVAAGQLKVPALGSSTKAATTQACPSTRDFRVVDMDQSDNVDTTYLLIGGKKLAQNTDANAAASKGKSTVLSNGSDNALINVFISPTMGCGTFTAPSITAPGGTTGALALNELQAGLFPPAGGPALVPLNDDFTVINNNGAVTQSLGKTNLYRAGVGQPQAANNANASGTTYCQQYAQSGLFIAQNEQLFKGTTSPAPAVANNLFTFLANRFATSFGPVPSLGCDTIFGVTVANLVKQTLNGNGVVTDATIDTATLQKIFSGAIKPGKGNAVASSSAATSIAKTSIAKTSIAKTSIAKTSITKKVGAAKTASSIAATSTTKITRTKAGKGNAVASSSAATSITKTSITKKVGAAKTASSIAATSTTKITGTKAGQNSTAACSATTAISSIVSLPTSLASQKAAETGRVKSSPTVSIKLATPIAVSQSGSPPPVSKGGKAKSNTSPLASASLPTASSGGSRHQMRGGSDHMKARNFWV